MSYATNDGLLVLYQVSNVSSPQFLSQVESGDYDSKVKPFYLFICLFISLFVQMVHFFRAQEFSL